MEAAGTSRFLFDLTSPQHEKHNLIDSHPKIAAELQKDLKKWAATLKTPGIPDGELRGADKAWYDHFFAVAGAEVRAKPVSDESTSKPQLREIIVSHADENN